MTRDRRKHVAHGIGITLIIVIMSTAVPRSRADPIPDFGEPHYAILGSFALEVRPTLRGESGRGHRIATFIPATTLLFIKAPLEPYKDWIGKNIEIDGEDYTHVVTQHGQLLLVPAERISLGTFKDHYPGIASLSETKSLYIFHQDSHLCEGGQPTCATGLFLRGGYVAEGKKHADVDVYKFIVRIDGRNFEGTLAGSPFRRLIKQGIVTNLRQRFPTYWYEQDIQEVFRIPCGKTVVTTRKKDLNERVDAGFSLGDIIPFFDFGATITASSGEEFRIQSTQGGEGISISGQTITIRQFGADGKLDERRTRRFIATSIERCEDVAGQEPVYISKLSIKESTTVGAETDRLRMLIEFDNFYDADEDSIGSGSPQWEIHKRAYGRTFLTSINKKEDYENAIRIWTREANGDAALAHIFLGVFNASCPSDERDECIRQLEIRSN